MLSFLNTHIELFNAIILLFLVLFKNFEIPQKKIEMQKRHHQKTNLVI